MTLETELLSAFIVATKDCYDESWKLEKLKEQQALLADAGVDSLYLCASAQISYWGEVRNGRTPVVAWALFKAAIKCAKSDITKSYLMTKIRCARSTPFASFSTRQATFETILSDIPGFNSQTDDSQLRRDGFAQALWLALPDSSPQDFSETVSQLPSLISDKGKFLEIKEPFTYAAVGIANELMDQGNYNTSYNLLTQIADELEPDWMRLQLYAAENRLRAYDSDQNNSTDFLMGAVQHYSKTLNILGLDSDALAPTSSKLLSALGTQYGSIVERNRQALAEVCVRNMYRIFGHIEGDNQHSLLRLDPISRSYL